MKRTTLIIITNLFFSFVIYAQTKSIKIVETRDYSNISPTFSLLNQETPIQNDGCGKTTQIALMDIEGDFHVLTCNYCRNGLFYKANPENNNLFYTLTPPDGLFGGTKAVLDCIEKIQEIKTNIEAGYSVNITFQECEKQCPTFFDAKSTILLGSIFDIQKGEKISDETRFEFLQNKIERLQKKYPEIYFSNTSKINESYDDFNEAIKVLDLIYQYRNNLLNEYKDNGLRNRVLDRIKKYKDWYTKSDNGRKNPDFIANLSMITRSSSFSTYDSEISTFNTTPLLQPLTLQQPLAYNNAYRDQLYELASKQEINKSIEILSTCSRMINDSEHLIDDISSSLKQYLRSRDNNAEQLRKIDLLLKDKPSDISVLKNMTDDISDIRLKNLFFALLSNKYKFKKQHTNVYTKVIWDELMLDTDVKEEIIDSFGLKRIERAFSIALEDYISLLNNQETSLLFKYSTDLKKDLHDNFNTEIKRMNFACKTVNTLHSDLQNNTYNPDIEELKNIVSQEYGSKLMPMGIVLNGDGSWVTASQYNINQTKSKVEEKRKKIKVFLGEKRYKEIQAQALNKQATEIRLPSNKEMMNVDYSYYETLDLLLIDELKNRLKKISSKMKNGYRLPTDEEWEIVTLLEEERETINPSFNQKMIKSDVRNKLKAVMEEIVKQSSYRMANSKFINLLLVDDFRKSLRMEGSPDLVEERCLSGDGKLFNEATISDVKQAINDFDAINIKAIKELAEQTRDFNRLNNLSTKQLKAGFADNYNNYNKIKFIKDSIKSSPLVITDLLKKKHDFRYDELLCIYIDEINKQARAVETGTKVLFWAGITASTAATIMSGGFLGFTVPAALTGFLGSAALATDILFITAQGFEAWSLYNLKKDIIMNNSAYYGHINNTLMAIDRVDKEKENAIRNMVIMAVIAAINPSVKLIKVKINKGYKVIAEKDGVVIREQIIPEYLDSKTGLITETKVTVKKTPDIVKTEKKVVTKKKEHALTPADNYKRHTTWENTPDGVKRTKIKKTVKTETVSSSNTEISMQEKPEEIKSVFNITRKNETVPTTVEETIVKETKPASDGNISITTTTTRKETTVFDNQEIIQTNTKKLNAKKQTLDDYNNGKISLTSNEVEKLQRDVNTLTQKIEELLGKNERSRITTKVKEVSDGTVTTEHTVVSTVKSARYSFEGPSTEILETSKNKIRTTLSKIGLKGSNTERLVEKLGNQTAKFSNFLEQTRICRAMTKDNMKFSHYASSTMWKLASSKFMAGSSTSLFMYWKDNDNWGDFNSDIGGDVVGQFVKAFGGAGVATIPLLGKDNKAPTSLFQNTENYEIYKQNIKNSLHKEKFSDRFRKAAPRAAGWSMLTKMISGMVYYGLDGAEEEYGDQALYASSVRLGYGIAWAVPSTALEVSLYDFIIGATCVIPGSKIFLTVSDKTIKAVNFGTATSIQYMYPLMTNWVYYWGRTKTYNAFGLKKKEKPLDPEEQSQSQYIEELDFNIESKGTETTTIDKYIDDINKGKIDGNKTYLIELPGYESL